jgi:competence protein ComEA
VRRADRAAAGADTEPAGVPVVISGRPAGPVPATPPAGFPTPWPTGPAAAAAEPDRPTPPEPEPDAPPADPFASAWPRSSGLGRLARRLAPVSWRGARLDPGRPGAVVLAVVAALAAVVAALGVWLERPQAAPVAALPAVVVDEPAAPAAAPAAGPVSPLVVSVSGKVARPGLVEVPGGARVADVLEAAGGALPGTDLAGLNLARKVGDGEQVAVGVPPPAGAAPIGPDAAGSAAGPAPAGPVDLNAATVQQLDALPGVGPVMAQRILKWRTRNGRFARVEQLREVEGIGERRFAQLRELVTV